MKALRRLAAGMALCAVFSSPRGHKRQAVRVPSSAAAAATDRRPRSARHDDGLRRHRSLVRPDRRGPAQEAAGPSASTGRTGIERKRSPTSRTSAGPLRYGVTDNFELFANIDVQRRIDADRRPVRAGGTPMDDPLVFQGWQTGLRRHAHRRQVQHPGALSAAASRVGHSRPDQAADVGRPTKGLGPARSTYLLDSIVSGEAGRNLESLGMLASCSAAFHAPTATPDDLRPQRRIPLGLRRRLPEPRQVPRHHRAGRRNVLRRRDHAANGPVNRKHSWQLGGRLARGFHHRLHLSGHQRLLHRLRRLISA